ncbi:MAG: PEGA domain-containing protein [Candidatus Zixiibacteriota bacterium]|nr:MAG: PEGA domain-containing protein [candidate division Zixibacteria bacterium]
MRKAITPWLTAIMAVAIIWVFCGCAAIFQGTNDSLDLRSEPSGAEVYVNGNLMGTTPVKLELKSKETCCIEFKKAGYQTQTHNIGNHVGAGWIVLDVLGGLVPVIVDAATGSWYSFNEETVNAVLQEQQGAQK